MFFYDAMFSVRILPVRYNSLSRVLYGICLVFRISWKQVSPQNDFLRIFMDGNTRNGVYGDIYPFRRRDNSPFLRIRSERRKGIFLFFSAVYVVAMYLRSDFGKSFIRSVMQSAGVCNRVKA